MPNRRLIVYIFFKILDPKNPNKKNTKYSVLFFVNKINPTPFINHLTGRQAVLQIPVKYYKVALDYLWDLYQSQVEEQVIRYRLKVQTIYNFCNGDEGLELFINLFTTILTKAKVAQRKSHFNSGDMVPIFLIKYLQEEVNIHRKQLIDNSIDMFKSKFPDYKNILVVIILYIADSIQPFQSPKYLASFLLFSLLPLFQGIWLPSLYLLTLFYLGV